MPEQLDLPHVIATYQAARDRRDTASALGTFTDDAVVDDDGHTYRGRDEVERWLSTAASKYTFTSTLLSAERTDAGWLLTNRLEGDFPGGWVDLRFGFTLAGDRIERLVIAP